MRIAALVLAIAIVIDIVFWTVAIAWQHSTGQRRWISDQLARVPWSFVLFALVFGAIGFGLLIMSTSLMEGPRP